MTMMMENDSVSFRWINCQCFEFRLPNGKTIITDPCYDYPENPDSRIAEAFRLRGFHTEDLEGCDYVILNHTHCDHIANLGDVIRRFHPVVICHTGAAAEIAEVYGDDLPLTSVYPVDYNGRYYFDGFTLDTYHGAHKPQKFLWNVSMAGPDDMTQSEKLKRLHTIGGFFNMNFVITLENGFKTAFVGGLDDGMEEKLRSIRPNILLRNKLTNDMDAGTVAGDWLRVLKNSYAQIVVPMHFEVWENLEPGFAEQTFIMANERAGKEGITARILPVKRTEWYTVRLSVIAGRSL